MRKRQEFNISMAGDRSERLSKRRTLYRNPGPSRPAPDALVTVQDTAAVPGGLREARFYVNANPLKSVGVISVGDGQLSVAQGVGTIAETLIAYGGVTYALAPEGRSEVML